MMPVISQKSEFEPYGPLEMPDTQLSISPVRASSGSGWKPNQPLQPGASQAAWITLTTYPIVVKVVLRLTILRLEQYNRHTGCQIMA